MDFPPTAMDDSDRSFQEIHQSPADMRQAMLDMAKHTTSRARSEEWLKTMRILVREKPSAPNTTHDALESQELLRIMRRTSLPAGTPYIAISYCWKRENIDWYHIEDKVPINVAPELGKIRRSQVPPDVLHRSLVFAIDRDIPAIWIDQECINQEDPLDKEDGIQAMDLFYEESAHPVAVLESCFSSQEELDAFVSITDPKFFEFDPDNIEALEDILEHLAEDAWLTRAWTLQESTSAGVKMTLLIGCPGLNKPEEFGRILGEFEISIWIFQEAMVNARNLIDEGLSQNIWPDTNSAINASNIADELWNRLPTIIPDRLPTNIPNVNGIPDSFDFDPSTYRQQPNAAQALAFLSPRSNTVFPDRLAILANLCNYTHRLPTSLLHSPHASFSTAALTLSILNGDTSLLSGYNVAYLGPNGRLAMSNTAIEDRRANYSVHLSSEFTSPANKDSYGYGFSWGPQPQGRLANLEYLEEHSTPLRLQPCTLSHHGLRVRGILWRISHSILVPDTQAYFTPQWEEELRIQASEKDRFDGIERQRGLWYEFCMCLLRELTERGEKELARTVWRWVEPNCLVWDTKGNMLPRRPYSFEQVFGDAGSSQEEGRVVHVAEEEGRVLRGRWSVMSLSVQSNIEASRRPTIPRKFIDTVCRDGQLLAGTPVPATASAPSATKKHDIATALATTDIAAREKRDIANDVEGGGGFKPRVWFDHTSKDDLVFTPWTNLGDEVPFSSWSEEAVSWCVVRTGEVGEEGEVLRCAGRRRGWWRAEGLEGMVGMVGEWVLA